MITSPSVGYTYSNMQEKKLKGKKILFVEDDVFVGDIVVRHLVDAGALCEWTKDGFDALSKMNNESFDIIITDLHMDRMDGSDMIERMRAKDGMSDTPVIILTNLSNNDEEVKKARELNVNGFLPKSSTSMQNLVGIVASVLN